MNVQMTCACGLRQDVPITCAGKTTPCAACGKPLTVPAMGIAVPRGKSAAPRPRSASPFEALRTAAPIQVPRPRTSGFGATALLLTVSGLLLLVLAGFAVWQLGLQAYLPTFNRVAQTPPAAPATPAKLPAAMPPSDPPASKPAEPATAPSEPPADKLAEPATPPSEPPANKPADPAPQVAKPAQPVVEKPQENKPAVPVAMPKRPFQAGDSFLQDLLVTQKSRFVVSGLPVATLLQYRIVSRYTVKKVHDDGALAVHQKIESAALLQADELTQGLLAKPVAQMPGTAFTLEVSPRGEVTKLAGADGALLVGPAKLPGGLGVQMASVLDADGWRELGQATFYQPEQRDKAGRWTRPMAHSWGPLGGWAGQVTYAFPGPDKAAQVKVPYALKLAYQPPKGPGAPARCRSKSPRATSSRRRPAARCCSTCQRARRSPPRSASTSAGPWR